jgi:hypothetical protein
MRLSFAHAPAPPTLAVPLVREYLVAREREGWFIEFSGEQFGPYNTEREALLFAIDAAHNLGEKGELTRVLSRDEAGEVNAVWTHGHDAYPSGL